MNQEKKKKRNFKQWIPFYIMGIPGLLYLFINNYLPLAGLQIAFKNFSYSKGMWASPWCGLKNFKFLFRTADAWIMIRNTLLYNIFWIILGAVLGVTAAILINEVVGKLKKKFYMTAILLPYRLPVSHLRPLYQGAGALDRQCAGLLSGDQVVALHPDLRQSVAADRLWHDPLHVHDPRHRPQPL